MTEHLVQKKHREDHEKKAEQEKLLMERKEKERLERQNQTQPPRASGPAHARTDSGRPNRGGGSKYKVFEASSTEVTAAAQDIKTEK